MELRVLASGSKGNCYLLGSKNNWLMIEAGIPFKKKVLPEIDFNLIHGVLVSHSHGDHASRLNEVLSYSIPVFGSKETMVETGLTRTMNYNPVEPGTKFKLADFTIIPFELKHDVRCFGYLIHHKQSGWILFATDTYYIPKRYKGLNHVLIECNYDKAILDESISKGKLPRFLKSRIMASHMGIDTVQEMLAVNDLRKVNNIVLLHLSDNNADPSAFKKRIQRQTGKATHIATPGLTLELYG